MVAALRLVVRPFQGTSGHLRAFEGNIWLERGLNGDAAHGSGRMGALAVIAALRLVGGAISRQTRLPGAFPGHIGLKGGQIKVHRGVIVTAMVSALVFIEGTWQNAPKMP